MLLIGSFQVLSRELIIPLVLSPWSSAGSGSAFPRFDRWSSRFASAKAHGIASCTQDTLKVFGPTVRTLHLSLVLSTHHENLKDLIALQTAKFIYRHGHCPFITPCSIAKLNDDRNLFCILLSSDHSGVGYLLEGLAETLRTCQGFS